MLNHEIFLKQISGLSELFDKQMTDVLLDIYYRALEDLSDDDFNRAMRQVVMTKTFHKMPLPAEIREIVQGNPDDDAIRAFDTFMRGKSRTGPYVSVIFEDLTIHAVVMAFGGWNDICMIPESEWKYRRKEWIETYKAFRKQPRTDTPMKLIGIIEANNTQCEDWQRFIPEPVRIGDGRRPMIDAGKERVMVTG